MRSRLILSLTLVAVLVGATLYLRSRFAHPTSPASVTVHTPVLAPKVAAAPTIPITAAPTKPTPVPQVATPEVAASERMYIAHASLRTPAVADPDSTDNRAILRTMIAKGLARSSATAAQP